MAMATASPRPALLRELVQPAVIVGALGYFVDIYDLVLFSIVRIASLKSLGVSGAALTDIGLRLINCQMIGMLVGGILWGILGDRRGRVTLLFGSILLYSLANIANGFVHTIPAYEFWRFVAGVGLAGELGGSITLVSEVLSKEARGYGTMLVATIGVSGAVVGGLVGDWVDWRVSYFIGGGMGLALLLLRIGVAESGMFRDLRRQPEGVSRGNFLSLFTDGKRFLKYLRCIVIGLPTWFVIAIPVSFAPEFAKAFGIVQPVSAGYAILFAYLGLTIGDLMSGLLSQWFASRKKIVFSFLVMTALAGAAYFQCVGQSAAIFYTVITLLGIGIGYWALFVTIAAEQFGTNIRATVATTVPNFVRGAVFPITLAFKYLKDHAGIVPAGVAIGSATLVLALLALRGMEETYGKDLDYHELT